MNDDYIPLSYINQFAYGPRRFWYMYAGEMLALRHRVVTTVLRPGIYRRRSTADE